MSPERLLGSGRLFKAGVASARVGMAVVGERNIIVGAERKERLGRRGGGGRGGQDKDRV